MKKIKTILSVLFASLLFVGCSVGSNTPSTDVGTLGLTLEESAKIGTKIKHGDVTITIEAPQEYTSRDAAEQTPPEHVIKLNVNIKNEGETPFNVGSLDFSAYTSDALPLEQYGYADSLGDSIEAGNTLEGSVYFIGTTTDIFAITYTHPTDDKTIAWIIR